MMGPRAAKGRTSAAGHEQLHRSAVEYYLSLFDSSTGGFRFASGLPPTLMATGYCVLGMEFSGGLDALTPERKRQIAGFVSTGLQPDGSFHDPLWADHPPGTGSHGFEYFAEETTSFCQQVLDVLLAPPPPRREWPASWLDGPGIHEHFDTFAWDDAWRDSNRVMFTLAQLCHDAERHQRPELLRAVDAGLDWVDAHQSARSGLWEGPHPVSLTNAMAATFHFIFFYGYRRRRLAYPERIIDSCLELQETHGLFSGRDVGHTCLDYDAVDLLAKAALTTDHRASEVSEAMRRARIALRGLYDPEAGGFAHCKERMGGPRTRFLHRLPLGYRLNRLLPLERTPVRGTYDTGSSLLRHTRSRANAISTWFRLLALELARPPDGAADRSDRVRFRRLPFLGFHDPLGIHAAEEATPASAADPGPARAPEITGVSERDPLVTAVIPAFNEADRLPDALTALRSQTYPRWEAVVVNDGSEDDTGRVAEGWAAAEPRVRAVHQENRGLAAARNAALRHAHGELIHCLDADDRIDAGFYAAVVSALRDRRARDPATDVGRCAVSRVGLVWEGGNLARVDPAPGREAYEFPELALRNVRQPVCHVFERRILEVTGEFDESLDHCQDWDLWMRFARVGVEFLPVNAALAWYRLRPDSLSSNWAGYLRDGRTVMERALAPDRRCGELGAAHLEDRGVVDEGTARFWAQNLLRAVSRGDEAGAERLFEWGRTALPEDFWRRPEAYGVRPSFEWAYDAPSPRERSGELMWNRGTSFLGLLGRQWPEIRAEDAERVARGLISRIVEVLERDAVSAGGAASRAPRRFPRPRGIAVLASEIGWTDVRSLGLWVLLALPTAARRRALELLWRLGLRTPRHVGEGRGEAGASG